MQKLHLVKWLNKQKNEAIDKAVETKLNNIRAAEEAEYQVIGLDDFLNKAAPYLQEFIKEYEKFLNKVNTTDGITMTKYGWHYGYNDFKYNYEDVKKLRAGIEKTIILETERYVKTRNNMNDYVHEVEKTYDTVITTVKNLPTAKAGLEYLQKLGFNIESIPEYQPVKQLPATITINVDTKYLMIPKEATDEK